MTDPLVVGPYTIIPAFPLGTTQKIAYTDSHGVIANGVGEDTRLVRVWCSTDAHIAVGSAPVATTDDMPVTGSLPEYFAIDPGQKVSAIRQTESGTLYITEL